MEKFNHNIPDLLEERKKKILEIFPELNSDGKINLDKLSDIFGDEGIKGEKYDFTWSGKTQEMEKIKPNNKLTLKPVKEESVNFDETNNIYIEGDNIEALKLLLKSYYGKIKMIYIDPPYNTGNDFIYNDNYTEYVEKDLLKSGQIDEEGNVLVNKINKNGRRHSNWLSFMYSRLYVARQLLKDDGVIFISIDDNEVHNLRKICDEIFGEENFTGCFLWRKKSTTTNVEGAKVSSQTDYNLCYQKRENGLNYRIKKSETRNYPHNDKVGNYRKTVIEKKNTGDYERKTMQFEIIGIKPREGKRWQIGEDTARELEQKNRFILEDGVVKLKIYDFEDKDTTSANPNLLIECGSTDSATKILNQLFEIEGIFDNPKSIELLIHFINLSQSENKDDIVLDFFSGSATTAHAIMKLNAEDEGKRKYIMVQIPQLTDEKSEAYKAGYKNICEIGKERIRRAGKKILEENSGNENIGNLDIGFKVFKVEKTNFNIFDSDIENTEQLQQQLEIFGQSSLAADYQPLDVLYEVILKEGLMLDEKINQVEESIFIAADRLINLKPDNSKLELKYLDNIKVYIAIDSSFNGADSKKTNIDLQLKENNIVFKVL